jgi:hypothetical protein
MAYLVGGRAISLPVEVRSAKVAFANYLVSVDDAYRFVADSGLQLTEVLPGRALCALSVVDYVDGDLGSYGEVALAFVVRPYGAPPVATTRARLGELLRGDVGIYMHSVPVTEEFPRASGVQIWGLPKYTAEISLTASKSRAIGTMKHEGEHVVTLTVRGPGRLRFPRVTFDTYTHRDGVLRVFPSCLGGRRAGARLGGAAVDVGHRHPMALDIRALGLHRKRAVASGFVEHCSGSFDDPMIL